MRKCIRYLTVVFVAFSLILVFQGCEEQVEKKADGNELVDGTVFEPRWMDIRLSGIEIEQEEVSDSTKATEGNFIIAVQMRDLNSAGDTVCAELIAKLENVNSPISLPSIFISSPNLKVTSYVILNCNALFSDDKGYCEPFTDSFDKRVKIRNRWVYKDFQLVHNGTSMFNPKIRMKDSSLVCYTKDLMYYFSEGEITVNSADEVINLPALDMSAFMLQFRLSGINLSDTLKYILTDAERNALSDTIKTADYVDLGEGIYETGTSIFVKPRTSSASNEFYIDFQLKKDIQINGESVAVYRDARLPDPISIGEMSFTKVSLNKVSEGLWDEVDGGIIFYKNNTDEIDPETGVAPGDYLIAAVDTVHRTLVPKDYINEFSQYGIQFQRVPDMYVRDVYGMGEYCTAKAARYYRDIPGGALDNNCAYIYADSYAGGTSESKWFLPNDSKMYKLFQRYEGNNKEALRKLFEGCWSGRVPPGGIGMSEGGFVLSSEEMNQRKPLLSKQPVRLISRHLSNNIDLNIYQARVYKEAGYGTQVLFDAGRNTRELTVSEENLTRDNYFERFHPADFDWLIGPAQYAITAGASSYGLMGCYNELAGGVATKVVTGAIMLPGTTGRELEDGLIVGDRCILEEGHGVKTTLNSGYKCEDQTIGGRNDWFLPDKLGIRSLFPFMEHLRYCVIDHNGDKVLYAPSLYADAFTYGEMNSSVIVQPEQEFYHRCMRIDRTQRHGEVYTQYPIDSLVAGFYPISYLLGWTSYYSNPENPTAVKYGEIYSVGQFLRDRDDVDFPKLISLIMDEFNCDKTAAIRKFEEYVNGDHVHAPNGSGYIAYVHTGLDPLPAIQHPEQPNPFTMEKGQIILVKQMVTVRANDFFNSGYPFGYAAEEEDPEHPGYPWKVANEDILKFIMQQEDFKENPELIWPSGTGHMYTKVIYPWRRNTTDGTDNYVNVYYFDNVSNLNSDQIYKSEYVNREELLYMIKYKIVDWIDSSHFD